MRDDELDERLTAADRMARVTVDGRVLDDVVEASREGWRRSRRARTGLVAGALALVLGGGIVAAPAVADTVREWLAIAEWQPEAGGEILPDSEMVDLSAPDLAEYIASRYPEWLPLAPGHTRQELIDRVVEIWAGVPEAGFTQEVGFREAYESLAYCGWVDAWLGGTDPAVAERAAEVMRDAIDWPAFTATDGGGRREFLTVFAVAAETGDADGVQFAAWQYGCPSWDGVDRSWWVAQNAWFQENDPRR